MKRFKIATAVMAVLMAVILSSCSSGEKAEIPPEYEGWKTYSYNHFIFHYTENNFWGRDTNIVRLSNAFERYLAEDCDFLAIAVPEEPIHFYIHNNLLEGKELTGRELPFHTSNQIHWGRQSAFGLELARFLIDKWGVRRTDFDFLYEGLSTLRDYGGLNYHHQVATMNELNVFIPLDSLADNELFKRLTVNYGPQDSLVFNTARLASHAKYEAASFVAFITYHHGINRFKMLWQSAVSFDKSIEELFDMDRESFQQKWVDFAYTYYKGTTRGENLLDSVIQVK